MFGLLLCPRASWLDCGAVGTPLPPLVPLSIPTGCRELENFFSTAHFCLQAVLGYVQKGYRNNQPNLGAKSLVSPPGFCPLCMTACPSWQTLLLEDCVHPKRPFEKVPALLKDLGCTIRYFSGNGRSSVSMDLAVKVSACG